MPPHSIDRKYRAALADAGFRRQIAAGGSASPGSEVYRLPAEGRWFLEARQGGEGACHVDVGLTLDTGGDPSTGRSPPGRSLRRCPTSSSR